MTEYHLTISGDEGTVEREQYDSLADAVHLVESNCTDDHDGWQFVDGRIKLTDRNGDHETFVHWIDPVDDGDA